MNTQQVANKLEVSRMEILIAINRCPYLRPVKRLGQGYLWHEAEIQQLQAYLATATCKRLEQVRLRVLSNERHPASGTRTNA